MKSQGKVFAWLALIALVVAILRFYMKGWAAAAGISPTVGSLLASITVVLFISMVIVFAREGRTPQGTFWRAVGWFVTLAAWSQALVITGILITASTGIPTYYEEMNGKHISMPPLRHALVHAVVIIPLAIVGSALGGAVYWVAKHGRKETSAVSS